MKFYVKQQGGKSIPPGLCPAVNSIMGGVIHYTRGMRNLCIVLCVFKTGLLKKPGWYQYFSVKSVEALLYHVRLEFHARFF